MTREEANLILDMVRQGANAPWYLVDFALVITGDLQPNESSTWLH